MGMPTQDLLAELQQALAFSKPNRGFMHGRASSAHRFSYRLWRMALKFACVWFLFGF
jgi:hypothetical protein